MSNISLGERSKRSIAVVNLALGFKLLDPVVSQARTWGFICQCQESNNWEILPRQPTERWKLQ